MNLLKRKESAIKDNESHYWNNWDIVYGVLDKKSRNGPAPFQWTIRCKQCRAKISTVNVSASAQRHMESKKQCRESYTLWLDHLRVSQEGLPPAQKEKLHQIQKQKSSNSVQTTINIAQHKDLLQRFQEQLLLWALLNSTSMAFRTVEHDALNAALKMIGFKHGLSRKYLANEFLEKQYSKFANDRKQSLDYYCQYQISADSWKYRNANNGKKLVGVTLNMPAGSCQVGDIFPTADDERVSSDYLENQISSLIDKLGKTKYIGCVFDGERAYYNAGKRLQAKYPWSIHMTCNAHMLNLLLKDISQTDSLKNAFDRGHKLVLLCNSKECRLALNSLQEERNGKRLPIRLGVETRFGFMVREIEDLVRSKDAIRALASDQELREKFNSTSTSTADQRDAFRTIDDREFWVLLELITEFLSPVVQMIHFIEQDMAMITQMYFIVRYLHCKFRLQDLEAHNLAMDVPPGVIPRAILFDFEKDMAEQVLKRFSYQGYATQRSSTADLGLFTLAYLLDLRFYWDLGEAKRPDISELSRKDREEAKKALCQISDKENQQAVLNEFEELLQHGLGEIPIAILTQIIKISGPKPSRKSWQFEKDHDVDNYCVAVIWNQLGEIHGFKYPLLAKRVAPNLFALHVTSCSTERLWSRMRHLYRPLRNRLSPEKAKKMLLINLSDSFTKNLGKRKRYDDMAQIQENASESDEEDMGLPEDYLDGVDLNNLPDNYFDLSGCFDGEGNLLQDDGSQSDDD
jgi:hypothetical protein